MDTPDKKTGRSGRTTRPPLALPGAALSERLTDAPDLLAAADAVVAVAELAPPVEPFAGFFSRVLQLFGVTRERAPLLDFWESRTPGSLRSASRYRWELSHRVGVPRPAYGGDPASWRDFRGSRRGEADPFDVEERLLLPIVLSENAELLLELVEHPQLGERASALLRETARLLRRDFARHVQMLEPWEDTFALWCLARQPHALALLHPIAVAIAACYAAECNGKVLGVGYPFHQKPLVSASAHLAFALVTLGSDLELAASLTEFVRASRKPCGGWGDGAEADVLTTLAAADLLSRIDPSFDAAPTIAFFASLERPTGFWGVLGPEAPWLTMQIVLWTAVASRTFGERFRWPHRGQAMRDHKTGLPFFGYFVEIADLLLTVPGLRDAATEIAFIDLVGFRTFNNQFGQAMGDEVLRLFAAHLERLPHTRSIRDGGDEFLVIGAPTASELFATLEQFRKEWPERFVEAFGADVPPVAPRILLGWVPGAELRHAREVLGRRIGELKATPTGSDGSGLLVNVGRLDARLGTAAT